MSNVLYIDCNAKNSRILTEDNNRYRYTLPNTITLPTGTQISAQSSVINLQGITGASIEIEKDLEETLIVQYYVKDTTFPFPTPLMNAFDATDVSAYNLYQDLCYVGNGAETMGGTGNYPSGQSNPFPQDGYGIGKTLPTGATYPLHQNDFGYSEITMPMCCGSQYDTTGELPIDSQYLVPFCGEITIKIPKGIYSISKIAQLITDQLNNVENPDNDESFIEEQQKNAHWTGYPINNTTSRRVEVMTHNPNNVAGSAANYRSGYMRQWNTDGARPQAPLNPTFKSYDKNGTEANLPPRPFDKFDYEEKGIPAVGLHPSFASDVRKNLIQGYLGTDTPVVYNVDAVISNVSADKKMFRGFQSPHSQFGSKQVFEETTQDYNNYSKGIAVGATQFSLDYDTEKNGFSIKYLHTPRYTPSFDKYGGKFQNPGQEAAFMRRAIGVNSPSENLFYNTGNSPAENIYQMANRPMTQTTGIQVLNWAYKTAREKGTKPAIDGQRDDLRAKYSDSVLDNIDKFRLYDEWFESDTAARDAWEDTLWYRLGFSYDDIQNKEKFESNLTPSTTDTTTFTSFKNEGFTTDQDLDTSSITSISTQYSSLSHAGSTGSTAVPEGGQIAINADIAEVQTFNSQDVNAPFNPFNNNKNSGPIQVFAYKGSLFGGAVMMPVITTGRAVVASQLPILSNDGYILITSDIVELDDITKGGQYLGILDLIPKSNLSNQDYVSDRNQMIHTLSNPKTIDDITINIINSNLTDVALRPNSTVLLKITFPIPKQTVLLAAQVNQQIEQEMIQGAVQASQASAGKPNHRSKNEEHKDRVIDAGETEHTRIHGNHAPAPEPREVRGRDEGGAGGGAREERRRSPSPEPTPEAKQRSAEREARARLRPRGERTRYAGQVPPKLAEEEVVRSGGRLTIEEARRGETGSGDSGIATQSRSRSAPPRGREKAPSPPPAPPRE